MIRTTTFAEELEFLLTIWSTPILQTHDPELDESKELQQLFLTYTPESGTTLSTATWVQ